MKKQTNDFLLKVVKTVVLYYCLFVLFAILAFNWTYIIDNGVSQWLSHGLGVCTLQGIYKPALIPYYIVKEVVDDRHYRRDLEADPYYQSVSHALAAWKIVGRRSFAQLDWDERHKVLMKCAEAYALVTLQSTQPPDSNDPYFRAYVSGLNTVAHTDYATEDVQQVDEALANIKHYLGLQYGDR